MSFTDVPTDLNSCAAIEDLRREGWVVGVGNNEYKPYDTVTRAQMAVLIVRAKYGVHVTPTPLTGMAPDVPTDYWGAKWISVAVKEELMDLYEDGNFYPRNPATRADVAVLIWLMK